MVVLVLLRRLEVLVPDLALRHVVVEIPLVARRSPCVHLDGDARESPQEVAVVGDEHERAVVRLQELLQPVDRGEVEVVGRLVEEQQVRLGREDPRQLGAHAPSAGERPERLRELVRREAEASERDLDARLDVVSAEVLELRLQLSVAPHLRGVREVALELLHLGLHLGEPRDAAQGVLEQRLVRGVRLRVLAREADARAPLDYELAGVRRHLAEDDLEERGLSRAVRTHHAHAVALVDAERDVRQDVLVSVVYRYSLEVKHLFLR